MNYAEFLHAKSQLGTMSGFEPVWMPSFLFDFQASLLDWATRKGRAAIFADCGLGKTPLQLAWAASRLRRTSAIAMIDDRVLCTDCIRLDGDLCRGFGRRYSPIVDLPRRCECFAPKAYVTDRRSGGERWPTLASAEVARPSA